ncbi:NAD-dependent epimerase/dehydratase family protein [candidate division WOR-3 bacterium]|nr:NAD-dependent epimerase/dehydratase family protein [candidate division WOR-3 bacterium]
MKILITGGLGYLGLCLLPKLSKFYDLRLLHWRKPEALPKYEFVKCDIRNKEEVEKAVDGIDVILHLAAKGAKDPMNVSFQDALSVNVMGTLNLLEAAEKYKIKKFIHISSIWVYGLFYEGILPEYFPIDEKHLLRPKSPYGITKLMAENLLEGYSKRAKFPIIVFRGGVMVREDFGYIALTREIPAGWFFQYIDVRDAANAIRLAIESKMEGCNVFNLTAGDTSLSQKVNTLDLIKKYYPSVKVNNERDFKIGKYKSLIDTTKIREKLCFKEEFPISKYLDWIKSGKKEEDYYKL